MIARVKGKCFQKNYTNFCNVEEKGKKKQL